MRTNLKEAEPQDADELIVAQSDRDVANGNKNRAEEALAHARVRLQEIKVRARTAPRGAALEAIVRDETVAEKMIGYLESDVVEAEASRIVAEERVSAIANERASVAAAEAVARSHAEIKAATERLTAAADELHAAIVARGLAVETSSGTNATAAAYGVPGVSAPSTREVLAAIGPKLGLHIGPIEEVGPAYRIVTGG